MHERRDLDFIFADVEAMLGVDEEALVKLLYADIPYRALEHAESKV